MKNIQVKRKILQMNYPGITSYNKHANMLSILSHNEDNLTWFYNFYFQLVINKIGHAILTFDAGCTDNLHIKDCPVISCHGLSRDFIGSNWNSFTEFIISCINSGYYLYFVIDVYYIPAYDKQYMKTHAAHEILVYGYDMIEQCLNIADNFKNGKYSYSTCSFQNIEEGYSAELAQSWDWLECVLLKEKPGYYPINIPLLKEYINDYISSNNSKNRNRTAPVNMWDTSEYTYGMEIYDILERHIEKELNILTFDIRPYQVLYDHKKYILMLLKYLHQQGYLLNSDYLYAKISFIEKKILVVRNLMLKYFTSQNKEIINRVIKILKEVVIEEKQVLTEMPGNIIDKPAFLKMPADVYLDKESLFIEYSGEWEKADSELNKPYYTENMNSYAWFMFFGSSISYVGTKNKFCGYADIYLDGLKYLSVNLFSPEDICRYTLFSKDDLPSGYHTISVVCSGIKDSLSCGNNITLDGFKTNSDGNPKSKIKNEVSFIGMDNITKGSWKSSFGIDGYDIIGVESRFPQYARIRYINALQYTSKPTTFVGALEIPGTSEDRIAACRFNNDFFTIDLIIAGNEMKDIAFYILDNPFQSEAQREIDIEIIDFETKQMVDCQSIKRTYEGIYVMYKIKGHFLINFRTKAGPNAVLSGIFFGSI